MSNAKFNIFLLVLFGTAMPVAVVLSTNLARASFEKVKLREQTLTVKGYAEKPISSDRAVFAAEISSRDHIALIGNALADRMQHFGYLETLTATRFAQHDLTFRNLGFAADQVSLGPVAIRTLYGRDAKGNATNDIEAHAVSQSLTIASNNVKSIADVARDVSGVIRDGVELSASPPQYIYTKLDVTLAAKLPAVTSDAPYVA